MSSWFIEHGSHYDPPREVLDLVARGELVDASWKNDTCPRFNSKSGRACMFVEHVDPLRRENEDRFSVYPADPEGYCYDPTYTGDDLDAALAELRAIEAQDGERPVMRSSEKPLIVPPPVVVPFDVGHHRRAVLAAMQQLDEIGGPEPETYIADMSAIAIEARGRADTCAKLHPKACAKCGTVLARPRLIRGTPERCAACSDTPPQAQAPARLRRIADLLERFAEKVEGALPHGDMEPVDRFIAGLSIVLADPTQPFAEMMGVHELCEICWMASDSPDHEDHASTAARRTTVMEMATTGDAQRAPTGGIPTMATTEWVIRCAVWGGVTGSRTALLKTGTGEDERIRRFASLEEAQAEADRLNREMNHAHSRASFSYTPEPA